jgi:hypothetical protein
MGDPEKMVNGKTKRNSNNTAGFRIQTGALDNSIPLADYLYYSSDFYRDASWLTPSCLIFLLRYRPDICRHKYSKKARDGQSDQFSLGTPGKSLFYLEVSTHIWSVNRNRLIL